MREKTQKNNMTQLVYTVWCRPQIRIQCHTPFEERPQWTGGGKCIWLTLCCAARACIPIVCPPTWHREDAKCVRSNMLGFKLCMVESTCLWSHHVNNPRRCNNCWFWEETTVRYSTLSISILLRDFLTVLLQTLLLTRSNVILLHPLTFFKR